MNHFLYKLIPPRPDFAMTMTETEAGLMSEHAAYWGGHLNAGRLVAFGPVLDPAGVWGLAVLEVDSEDEARALGDGDPAVTSGMCTFDVYPMGPSIVRP